MRAVHHIGQEFGPGQRAGHPIRRIPGLRRPIINITPVERLGRVVVGLFAMVGGVLLILGAGSLLAGVLEGLLFLAGADLAVTGALGHCPLYRKLGYVPPSLQWLS